MRTKETDEYALNKKGGEEGETDPARFDPPFWPPVIALIVPTEKSDLSNGDVDEAMHNCGEFSC